MSPRILRLVSTAALVAVACVGNDPEPVVAPAGTDAGVSPPVVDGGMSFDAAPDASDGSVGFCASHGGTFCADFDSEGPLGGDWTQAHRTGGDFSFSTTFYRSPPRAVRAHMDALTAGSSTPSSTSRVQLERDLPTANAKHLRVEAALQIDIPKVLPIKVQLQFLAIYLGPGLGSVSLIVDQEKGWRVYATRYEYPGDTDSGVVPAIEEFIPLAQAFPPGRMVPMVLDVFLEDPWRIKLTVDGAAAVDTTSAAVKELAAMKPGQWSTRVGALQARGDTPATDVTFDDVLLTQE